MLDVFFALKISSGLYILQTQFLESIGKRLFSLVLSAASGGEQLHPDPLRFGFTGRFHSRHDFVIFRR
jgi:hypothetical protein